MGPLFYTTMNIFINLLLVIIKIMFGLIFNSVAIISDGVHSLTDFLTDIVSYIGIKKSFEPRDEEHPLGHGRYEYVASLITGMLILFLGIELVKSLLLQTEHSVPSVFGCYVVIITIIIKICTATILIKKGKKYDNYSLIANGYEGINDILTSIVALIGVIIAQLDYDWVKYADVIAALIIVFIFIRTGFVVIRTSINLILGTNINGEIRTRYNNIIYNTNKEIKSIKDMLIIKDGPYHQIIVNIQFDGAIDVKSAHDIATIAKQRLLKESKISYVKVHIEPYENKKEL